MDHWVKWVDLILQWLFVAVAVVMTFFILLQEGKGGGLAALGGTKAAGVEGVTNPIRRFTAYLAAVFFLIAIMLGIMHRPEKSSFVGETARAVETPATTPAPAAAPASNAVTPAEPAKTESKTAEPAKSDAKPAEPAKTDAKPAEPAKTDAKAVEAPKDASKPADQAKPVEPAKSEPAKVEAPKTDAPKASAPKTEKTDK